MNSDVEKIYNHENDIWGFPQEYKGVKLYPVKVKDTNLKCLFYKLFTYPKDSIFSIDPKILKKIMKMSYLKFILFSNLTENVEEDLLLFLKYVTRSDNVKFHYDVADKNIEKISIKLIVDSTVFSEYDFDNIREMILEQNGLCIEYINEYHEEMESILKRANLGNNVNFEDEMFTLALYMKKSLEELGEYTLYQINNLLERMIVMKQFDLFKPLESAGQIKLKSGEIKNYLYHKDKVSRYSSIKMNKEKFVEDILPGLTEKIK